MRRLNNEWKKKTLTNWMRAFTFPAVNTDAELREMGNMHTH